MHAMSWGEVELEPEVRDWFLALDEEDQARVVKTRQRERREVDRVRRAHQRCVDEQHTAEED